MTDHNVLEHSELKQAIDQSVEFPITHENLIEQMGGMELIAPTGDTVPLSKILTRTGEPTYRSPDMVYTSIIGNLDDRFIGRKYYDDRSGTHTLPDPRRSTRQSR